MKTISISNQECTSTIFVGKSIQEVSELLPDRKIVIVTDSVVKREYGDLFPSYPILEISTGEKIKTLETASLLYEAFLKLGLDRSSFVLGIGGGIVCDIAGFCAATYMRGINFGFVSTTLLSQVDASVGGKNGINFNGFKNIVGTFAQPQFVVCDVALLKSLPEEIFRCGLAEIIKIAMVRDIFFFQWLEQHVEDLVARETDILKEAIYQSVRLKADVVMEDETEKGLRRLLNFGHTFGHAIEAIEGVSHGDAVAVGMIIAGKISVKLGCLDESDLERLLSLIRRAGLPSEIPKGNQIKIQETIWKDKKKEEDAIHLVLVKSPGVGKIVVMPFQKLEEVFYAVC